MNAQENVPKNLQLAYWADEYSKLPIRENTVLYEYNGGKKLQYGPRAIFEQLRQREDLVHVWVLSDFGSAAYEIQTLANQENVVIVKKDSPQYVEYISTAKYLICSSILPIYYVKRKEQVVVLMRRGTPADPKITEGYLMDFGLPSFAKADYIVSSGPWETQQIYQKEYQLKNFFQGEYLEVGHPSTDRLIHFDRQKTQEQLEQLGVQMDKNIAVCIVPWRNMADGFNIQTYRAFVLSVMSCLKRKDLKVLYQLHPQDYQDLPVGDRFLRTISFPSTIDTAGILGMAEAVIGVEQATLFDFMATGKPVIYYNPDKLPLSEEYGDFCPVAQTPEEIAAFLDQGSHMMDAYSEDYGAMREKYNPYDDGNVCQRVISRVFDSSAKPQKTLPDKQKILVVAEWKEDSKRVWFRNLLSMFDGEQSDITLLVQEPDTISLKKELTQLPQDIRIVCRTGFYQTDEKRRDTVVKAFQQFSEEKDFERLKKAVPQEVFAREVSRLLGENSYDLLIYSGEDDTFLRLFCQQVQAKEKIVIGDAGALGCAVSEGNAQKAAQWKNIVAANQEFDRVYWVSPAAREYAQKNGLLGDRDGGMLNIPYLKDCTKLLQTQQELEDIDFEKKKYSIITCSNGEFVFIPRFQKDQLNFVVVAQQEYLESESKLLEVWKADVDKKGTLYLLDPDNLLLDAMQGQDVKKEGICYIHGRKISSALLANCSDFVICGPNDRLIPYVGFFEKRLLLFDEANMAWKEQNAQKDPAVKQPLPFTIKEIPGRKVDRLWNGDLELE